MRRRFYISSKNHLKNAINIFKQTVPFTKRLLGHPKFFIDYIFLKNWISLISLGLFKLLKDFLAFSNILGDFLDFLGML